MHCTLCLFYAFKTQTPGSTEMLATYQTALWHSVDDPSLIIHHTVHLKSHCSVFLEPLGALLSVLNGGARVRRLQLEASVGRNSSGFWHLVVSWMSTCRRIPLPTVSGSNLVWRQKFPSDSRLPGTENARCHNLEDDGPTENLKTDVNQYVFVDGQVPVSCNIWGCVSGFAEDFKSPVMLRYVGR